MPSTPAPQSSPDFEKYFKAINERLDRFETQFKPPKVEEVIKTLNTPAPAPVKKEVHVVPKQPIQPKQQEPEKVLVYSAFKPNPWNKGIF